MSKSYVVTFGVGKWDSWGFGVNYCHYGKSVTIDFIHWYAYIEWFKKKD